MEESGVPSAPIYVYPAPRHETQISGKWAGVWCARWTSVGNCLGLQFSRFPQRRADECPYHPPSHPTLISSDEFPLKVSFHMQV